MPALSPVARLIDEAEMNGILNLRTLDIAKAAPSLSSEALRQALHRLQQKGRILPVQRGAGHWLVVPLRDAIAGAPPLEAWLHSYLAKTLDIPYYVGLLSAAECYGASPYAVMTTKIVVEKARRPLSVGRHQLVFLSRSNVEAIPTQWHETAEGRFKISTPEVTALELVQRQQLVGGGSRVLAVLQPLFESCSLLGLQKALDIIQDVSAAQRLGGLLQLEQQAALANVVIHWLEHKRTRPLSLMPGQSTTDSVYDSIFKVYLPFRPVCDAYTCSLKT